MGCLGSTGLRREFIGIWFAKSDSISDEQVFSPVRSSDCSDVQSNPLDCRQKTNIFCTQLTSNICHNKMKSQLSCPQLSSYKIKNQLLIIVRLGLLYNGGGLIPPHSYKNLMSKHPDLYLCAAHMILATSYQVDTSFYSKPSL